MVTQWGTPSAAWTVVSGRGLDSSAATFGDRQRRYAYLDAWDAGDVFAPASNPALVTFSAVLKQDLRLYRHTRLVYNPAPDLLDFWGAAIYPGVLTRDGQPLPDGTPSAIPFAADTQAPIIQAASQVWWWSGMDALKTTAPQLAASAGNVLLELVDDLPGQKVYIAARPAAEVRACETDAAGDVQFYSVEYDATEILPGTELLDRPQTRVYRYRYDVSKTEFASFRDGQPFPLPGAPGARYRNPYGFVPACWVPHQPGIKGLGVPALQAGLVELLEINSLQSMLDDGVGRATKPIPVFVTKSPVELIVPETKRPSSGMTIQTTGVNDDSDRESHLGIRIEEGSFGKLDPSGDIGAIAAYLTQRKAEFDRHYPELSMWESLRQRDVSGVAAEILHGDTRNKVLLVRSLTDRQLVKATQMAISMAVFRREGWRDPGAAQAVFAGFAPTAWEQGDLDFEIAPRPLIPAPPLQQEEQAQLADILINQLGVSPEYALTLVSVPKKYITQAMEEKAQASARADAMSAQINGIPPDTAPVVPSGAPGRNGNGGGL